MDIDTDSDIDESTLGEESSDLPELTSDRAPLPPTSSDSETTDSSERKIRGGASGAAGASSSLSSTSAYPTGFVQGRGRSWRLHRLRGRSRSVALSSFREGNRIRDLIRRPRCGLSLLRSLRNDSQLCVPEARTDPRRTPRHPGKVDKYFCPRDGDLLLRHVKKIGKRVLEFFDPEHPICFEDGDYLLRFKVDNYSLMHQTFVTTRGYLYHHGHWVYLGKDADQMELS